MTDLTYNLSALQDLGSELLTIIDVMNGDSPAVRYDADDIGHPLVHDALGTFTSNWDDRREQLTGSVQAVGTMALESADVLKETDDELAAEIRRAMDGS